MSSEAFLSKKVTFDTYKLQFFYIIFQAMLQFTLIYISIM